MKILEIDGFKAEFIEVGSQFVFKIQKKNLIGRLFGDSYSGLKGGEEIKSSEIKRISKKYASDWEYARIKNPILADLGIRPFGSKINDAKDKMLASRVRKKFLICDMVSVNFRYLKIVIPIDLFIHLKNNYSKQFTIY